MVGYSGGRDSKALLYALHALKPPFPTIIVHINHGWRKEADQEEKEIRKEAAFLKKAVYTKKIVRSEQNNREDRAREDRLSFFNEVAEKTGAQGIVLAHHRQDQAETVLKRLLEGASLQKLHGMLPKKHLGNLTIFRPLLDVSEKELLHFLNGIGKTYLEDPTNHCTKYLRARLRQHLLPQLEASFGKGVQKSLIHLAKQSQDLSKYLEQTVQKRLDQQIEGPFGMMVPNISAMSDFEKKYLIQKLLEKRGDFCKRAPLEELLVWTAQKKSSVSLPLKNTTLYLHQDALFFLNKTSDATDHLHEKRFYLGDGLEESCRREYSWTDYFQGKVSFFVPKGNYYTVKRASTYWRKKLGKQKIPLPIRNECLVLMSDHGEVYTPFCSQLSLGVCVEFFFEDLVSV